MLETISHKYKVAREMDLSHEKVFTRERWDLEKGE
jgi:hypothetical protein